LALYPLALVIVHNNAEVLASIEIGADELEGLKRDGVI
jgi:hypothetical protein